MQIKLIKDWRKAWRFSSVKFAALMALLIGFAVDNAQIIIGFLGLLPNGILGNVLSIIAALLALGLPLFFRITKIRWRKDGDEINPEG